MKTLLRLAAAGLIVIGAVLVGVAQAQTFPSKALHLIVPFPPGGAADVTGRILAEHMSKTLGQPVIVDNRPGGTTVIGTELALRSPADGYTILVVFPSFVIGPAIRKATYDPLTDFKAVGQTVALPMAIAVNPLIPAKTLRELLALARAKPGEINYGTAGTGGITHVIGEMLNLSAKTNLTHVPFQGEMPALTAASGGHLSAVLMNASVVAPFVKNGKLRALVVTSPERVDTLPEVPTVREAGFPELESVNWSGFVVPAATPQATISRLNSALVGALRNPEVQEKLKAYGMSPASGTPEQFGAFLQSEAARYAKIVREARIKAD